MIEMFSFLHLRNNSVTIRLNFLLLSISEIIQSKAINILLFFGGGGGGGGGGVRGWGLYSTMFYKYHHPCNLSLGLLIKNLYFVFPDPELPAINILYG